MYDVIVIGARCAGSPTAMLLARKGYRVLLVDRATFPSDTMSTHFVHPPGLARLASWGLLDELMATGCPPVTRMSFDVGPFALVGVPPPQNGVGFAAAPRRTVLDHLLVDAAIAAGVELRPAFTVTELTSDGERITGIRGREEDDGVVTETAHLVVGADGLHSLVARTVGAPVYEDHGTLTCATYAYWADVPISGGELYPRGDRFVIAFPTHDELTVVVTMVAASQAHTFRRDLVTNYLATLDLIPDLAARVRAGHRVGHLVSTADLPNMFRKPYGPGWALVGDAGYHEDPLLAHGISNAFRDAGLLAEAIDAGLSGRGPLDASLAGYEQRRNQAAMPLFELGCQLSMLGPPPPEMQQLLGALHGNQEAIDRFWGAIQGTVPVSDVFGQEAVSRLVGSTA